MFVDLILVLKLWIFFCSPCPFSVQKPREQVADAEALLDIANALVSSVKSYSSEGITPSDFVNCLLKDFGQPMGGLGISENDQVPFVWKDLGVRVSPIFRNFHGCCTM